MSDTFLTFKVFSNSETAKDFADILKQNDILCFIEEDALVFDPSYANNEFNKDYRLKVRQEDFERANKVLQDYYNSQLDKADKDYYLFEFTDEELQKILAKPDEWGPLIISLHRKYWLRGGNQSSHKRLAFIQLDLISARQLSAFVTSSATVPG